MIGSDRDLRPPRFSTVGVVCVELAEEQLVEVRLAKAGPREDKRAARDEALDGELDRISGSLDLHPVLDVPACRGCPGVDVFAESEVADRRALDRCGRRSPAAPRPMERQPGCRHAAGGGGKRRTVSLPSGAVRSTPRTRMFTAVLAGTAHAGPPGPRCSSRTARMLNSSPEPKDSLPSTRRR